jgi:hypothetical protein
MSVSEEFSSPDVVQEKSPLYSPFQTPATLRRQNADLLLNRVQFSEFTTVNLSVQCAADGGRLQKLGFGRKEQNIDVPPQFKDTAACDAHPRVEWTKFFSNVWNAKNHDAIHGCESLEIASDISSDGSGVIVDRPSRSPPPAAAPRALGTASIERKYVSPNFKPQTNSLLLTKLQVSASEIDVSSPETVSVSKTTPDYEDPRLIMRRKMMMRPSLAKKLEEKEFKNSEEDEKKKLMDDAKAVAKAQEIKAKNMQILSVRRKMMMRPSKVKQIAEMESNLRTLQAAIDHINSEKMAVVQAKKKAENARRLAVRRQMMQRPSKTVAEQAQSSDDKIALKKRQGLQRKYAEGWAYAPNESNTLESSLDELLEQFSIGLRNGIFRADSLVSQLAPSRSRGVYQSPLRTSTADHNSVV